MRQITPQALAGPLLGGPEGTHQGPADRRFRRAGAASVFLLLGVNALAGVLLQAPCFHHGWDFPRSSFRQCASPMAGALSGLGFPEAAGRAPGDLAGFSPVTAWAVALGRSVSADDPAAAMAFLVLFSVLAVAVLGIALWVLAGRSGRPWLPLAFVSPVVFLSIGQSLDTVGVAAVLWALVLVDPREPLGRTTTGRLVGAGVLLAVGLFVNPLAALVVAGLVLVMVRRGAGRDLPVLLGSLAIAAGVCVLADGRVVSRLRAWWAEPIDRGSFASVVATLPDTDLVRLARTAVAVGLGVLLAVVAVAALRMLVGASRGNRGRGLGTAEAPHDLAVLVTVFLGTALLVLPAAPVTSALWLLPFAVLAVHRMWVHGAWMLSELALFLAVNLADANAADAGTGLSNPWLVFITMLRLLAVLVVVVAAGEGILRRVLTAGLPAPEPRRLARGSGAPAESDTSQDRPVQRPVPAGQE